MLSSGVPNQLALRLGADIERGISMRTSAALLAISLSLSVGSAANAAEEPYNWSDDRAAVTAVETIIKKCLDQKGDSNERWSCLYEPNEICTSQYEEGRANQYDVNRCANFSGDASERVLDSVYARLINSGSAPKELEASQAKWREWNDFDCRAIADYVGTKAAMDYGACRSKHAADRVFDLMQITPK